MEVSMYMIVAMLRNQILKIWEYGERGIPQVNEYGRTGQSLLAYEVECIVEAGEKHCQNAEDNGSLEQSENGPEQPVQPAESDEVYAGLDEFAEELEEQYHQHKHHYEYQYLEEAGRGSEIWLEEGADQVRELQCRPGPGYNRNYCNDLLGKSLEKALQQGGGQHEGQYDIQNAHVLLKIQYFTIFADYYTRNCVPKRKIRQKI